MVEFFQFFFLRISIFFRRKFSIVVVACGILSSASFWRGNQVGGLPRRSTLVTCRGEDTPLEVKTNRGHLKKRAPRNLGSFFGEELSRAGISAIHSRRNVNSHVLWGVREVL